MPDLWQLQAIQLKTKQNLKSKDKRLQLSNLHLNTLPTWHLLCPVHITTLDISHNIFQTLPDCLYSLVHLQQLFAQNNRLVLLSDGIQHFQNLTTLNLAQNHISQLPKSFTELKKLEIVNLSGNLLKSLTKESLLLPKLKSFHVTRNPIKNIPRDVYINGLPALWKYFNISFKSRPICLKIDYEIESNLCDELKNVSLRKVVPAFAQSKGHHAVGWDANTIITSDYVSCSGSSQENQSSEVFLKLENDCGNSCSGDHGSECGEELNCCSEEHDFDLCDVCSRPLCKEPFLDYDVYYEGRLEDRCKFIVYRNAAVIIPEHNRNHHMQSEFSMNILSDVRYQPEVDEHTSLASHVVSLTPHRTCFYPDKPARIKLPLFVSSICEDNVVCFYSDTGEDEDPFWLQMPVTNYKVFNDYVEIKAEHFSLFTVLVKDSAIHVSHYVTVEDGGCLQIPEIPSFYVNFPKGCLKKDITASANMYFSNLPQNLRIGLNQDDALATPVVFLGPHGCKFHSVASDPVTIRLPLPNYPEICQTLGSLAELTIWSTETLETKPSKWRKLDVDFEITFSDGIYNVIFSTPHFTGFAGFFKGLASQLNQSRLGLSWTWSNRDVNFKCQAFMPVEDLDSEDKFSLLVVCHNAANTLQDFGNARRIGGSIKPVTIKQGGDIQVRLAKSDYFEADTGTGEDASLIQIEKSFHGNEFEKQFACKFKGEKLTRGVFGKVFVTQKKDDGSEISLFQFNLIKSSDEPDQSSQDPWSMQPLVELAEMHGIIFEDNWKVLSHELGFTDQEIFKFSQSVDPFKKLVASYRQRGGMHELFSQTMSEVARKLRLGHYSLESENRPASSSWWPSFFYRSQSSSAASSPARSTSTLDEDQPSTSRGVTRRSRKRAHPTCAATAKKRMRYDQESSNDELLENLQISPPGDTPPRTPPRSPQFYGSIPSFSRSSPPLPTLSQISGNTTVVGSQPSARMSSMVSVGNAPNTSAFYANVPSSSSTSTTPMPALFNEQILRQSQEELTHRQIYRIAPLTQTHWKKIARLVRGDDQIENDIKNIEKEYSSKEDHAIQMMLKWKTEYTDTCTKGGLYSALMDIKQKSLANDCMKICATE